MFDSLFTKTYSYKIIITGDTYKEYDGELFVFSDMPLPNLLKNYILNYHGAFSKKEILKQMEVSEGQRVIIVTAKDLNKSTIKMFTKSQNVFEEEEVDTLESFEDSKLSQNSFKINPKQFSESFCTKESDWTAISNVEDLIWNITNNFEVPEIKRIKINDIRNSVTVFFKDDVFIIAICCCGVTEKKYATKKQVEKLVGKIA